MGFYPKCEWCVRACAWEGRQDKTNFKIRLWVECVAQQKKYWTTGMRARSSPLPPRREQTVAPREGAPR